jgi:hypothetical protein
VALAGAALVGALTTGCDDGPECIRSHTDWHFIPVYNGKTTTLVWTPYTVCDEYAKESAKPNG